MGENTTFRREDRVGLIAAVVLHLALVAALTIQVSFAPPMRDMAERMTVSLASDVGLEATAPNPVEESRVAIAPTLSEELGAEAEPVVEDAAEAPAPTAPASDRRAVIETETPGQPEHRSTPASSPSPDRIARAGGGSRISDDFLAGRGNSTSTDETRIPASEIGPSAQASIVQAIVRQIRPHWTAPNGVDAEKLVTELSFNLNEDGSLKGRPRVLRQGGETAANRPQKALHAERAIRAVQLAAPFDLPPEYYNAWKTVRGARFDRNLSQ